MLENASFESTGNWNYYTNGGSVTGYYDSSWSSVGSRNYTFQRASGSTSISYYAQITQYDVDFTRVTSIVFDCLDYGIDLPKLQFFIDEQMVGEYINDGGGGSWYGTEIVFNIELPLSQTFTGEHDFMIRMQEYASHSPMVPKYYRIDNIRLVPEPTTICLLGLGALGLVRRKK
jgi:hypothetical protein